MTTAAAARTASRPASAVADVAAATPTAIERSAPPPQRATTGAATGEGLGRAAEACMEGRFAAGSLLERAVRLSKGERRRDHATEQGRIQHGRVACPADELLEGVTA